MDRSDGYDVVLVSVVALPDGVSGQRVDAVIGLVPPAPGGDAQAGMAGGRLLSICAAFSARVIRETRSAARSVGE